MQKKIVLAIIVVIVFLGVLYFLFNPADSNFFPKCPLKMISGLKCPGCGSQRAVHSLLHLDIVTAFKYNALLVLSLPIVIILGYAEIYRVKKPELYVKIHKVKYIFAYMIFVILWWICRNIFNW